ncbi:hypothetical protein GGS21DRAFT_482521 [Xylaria nigripes]|nr:hypothetical protein GGS21DRAFT_482521 [Xylaria nigripes]
MLPRRKDVEICDKLACLRTRGQGGMMQCDGTPRALHLKHDERPLREAYESMLRQIIDCTAIYQQYSLAAASDRSLPALCCTTSETPSSCSLSLSLSLSRLAMKSRISILYARNASEPPFLSREAKIPCAARERGGMVRRPWGKDVMRISHLFRSPGEMYAERAWCSPTYLPTYLPTYPPVLHIPDHSRDVACRTRKLRCSAGLRA